MAGIDDTAQVEGSAGNVTAVRTVSAASTGERAVPYHCPYCAEEDLRPLGATPGAWHCRACTRTFSVKYLGMQPLEAAWPPAPPMPTPPPPTLADRHPTGAR